MLETVVRSIVATQQRSLLEGCAIMLRVIGTALLTAVLTSVFWIWFYGTVPQPSPQVARSGPVVTVKAQNSPPVVVAEQVEVAPSGLALPVMGIKADQLTDTFDAARSAGRRHDAIDIMAAEGTPVIAAADGTVEKLFNSVRGGMTIYERSTDGKWEYYYAHLAAYAPGLQEGQQVKRGQVIARVGHTGDASAAGPHLHFAINTMGPTDRWWNGTAINPYPLLAGKKASG
jgi:murein DD-endopeptidase MepM/ murein hydrolase activator NlpD